MCEVIKLTTLNIFKYLKSAWFFRILNTVLQPQAISGSQGSQLSSWALALQVSSSESVTIALKYGSIDVILEDQGQTSVEIGSFDFMILKQHPAIWKQIRGDPDSMVLKKDTIFIYVRCFFCFCRIQAKKVEHGKEGVMHEFCFHKMIVQNYVFPVCF